MALVKGKDESAGPPVRDRRQQEREGHALIAALADPDPTTRRWAARDLAGHSEAAGPLCERLSVEVDAAVRTALFDSVVTIGSDEVVAGLLPLLRGEDAALRNGAVEALQAMPDAVAPHMQPLLHDSDPDVRIFAVDILRVLPHPDVPHWLLEVVEHEAHVNVLATALDRLAEVGTPEMVTTLQGVAERWAHEPYIRFAAETAIERSAQ